MLHLFHACCFFSPQNPLQSSYAFQIGVCEGMKAAGEGLSLATSEKPVWEGTSKGGHKWWHDVTFVSS